MNLSLLKRYSGFLLLCSISCSLLFIYVNQTLENAFPSVTFLLVLLLPTGLASSLLVGAVWLWHQDVDGKSIFRIGVWALIGMTTFAIGAGLIILYQDTQGVIIANEVFMIANTASGGAVGGFIIGLYDSRRRQARIEASQLNQKITVLNRVLRHDIRTRGNIISGYAKAVNEKCPNHHEEIEDIIEQVDKIVKIGDQAKEMEDILREETQDPEVIDIVPLIKTSCAGVRQEYPTANISATLPETQLVIAHPLVKSALNNIVENAIEHNNKPTPEVRISCDTLFKNGTQYMEIQIADNGPGIPQNEIEVLESGYETELNHLSGLGLWMVNWTVTNSSGTIRFESNEPEGSIVSLQFKTAENQ